MDYTLSGQFLEACDCTVICPCWVDDDPVGGHCTGFILWDFERDKKSTITDDHTEHNVTGCRVVSVATHSGKRRGSTAPTTSMLYIDVSKRVDETVNGDAAFEILRKAFTADPGSKDQFGPLAELAEVSGTIVGAEEADILFDLDEATERWTASVTRRRKNDGDAAEAVQKSPLIEATGHPARFDTKDVENQQPLNLSNTALSYELQAENPVTAQKGDLLAINVGALPGGSLEVTGRSGMRGTFKYEHADPVSANAGPADQ